MIRRNKTERGIIKVSGTAFAKLVTKILRSLLKYERRNTPEVNLKSLTTLEMWHSQPHNDYKKVVSCFVSSGKGRLRVKQGQRHKPLFY